MAKRGRRIRFPPLLRGRATWLPACARAESPRKVLLRDQLTGVSEHEGFHLARRKKGGQPKSDPGAFQAIAPKDRDKPVIPAIGPPDGEDDIGVVQFSPCGVRVRVGQRGEVARHLNQTRSDARVEQLEIFVRGHFFHQPTSPRRPSG